MKVQIKAKKENSPLGNPYIIAGILVFVCLMGIIYHKRQNYSSVYVHANNTSNWCIYNGTHFIGRFKQFPRTTKFAPFRYRNRALDGSAPVYGPTLGCLVRCDVLKSVAVQYLY